MLMAFADSFWESSDCPHLLLSRRVRGVASGWQDQDERLFVIFKILESMAATQIEARGTLYVS